MIMRNKTFSNGLSLKFPLFIEIKWMCTDEFPFSVLKRCQDSNTKNIFLLMYLNV